MQESVQDRILVAVANSPALSASGVLAACRVGADERDFWRAFKLLCFAGAISGPPLALTDEGRRRLHHAA